MCDDRVYLASTQCATCKDTSGACQRWGAPSPPPVDSRGHISPASCCSSSSVQMIYIHPKCPHCNSGSTSTQSSHSTWQLQLTLGLVRHSTESCFYFCSKLRNILKTLWQTTSNYRFHDHTIIWRIKNLDESINLLLSLCTSYDALILVLVVGLPALQIFSVWNDVIALPWEHIQRHILQCSIFYMILLSLMHCSVSIIR